MILRGLAGGRGAQRKGARTNQSEDDDGVDSGIELETVSSASASASASADQKSVEVMSSSSSYLGKAQSSSSDTSDTTTLLPSRTNDSKSSSSGFFSSLITSLKSPLKTIRQSDLYGDYGNIAILLFLYTLQAVPMGLSAVIPFVIQERKLGYSVQAVFSVVSLPFSFKLLWAPLVDSYYSPRIGRRKSWVIPTQLICGCMLLFFADTVNRWLGADGSQPNSFALTIYFFITYLLMATQDIAVDAWCLTMLQKKNIGYASTTNAVGQVFGISIVELAYLILSSPDLCNKYLRSVPSDEPLMDVSGMLKFWGVFFLISTAFITFFKTELPKHPWDAEADEKAKKDRAEERQRQSVPVLQSQENASDLNADDSLSASDAESSRLISRQTVHPVEQKCSGFDSTPDSPVMKAHGKPCETSQPASVAVTEEEEEYVPESIGETLRILKCVLKLPAMQLYLLFQLTSRFIIAPTESLVVFKLMERGLSKGDLTVVSTFQSPVSIITSIFMAKLVVGPNALRRYLILLLPRIVVSLFGAFLVYIYPSYASSSWILVVLIAHTIIHTMVSSLLFVAGMAFSSRISDPRIGGTIVTLFNTAMNLSGALPRMIVLSLVERLTFRTCMNSVTSAVLSDFASCGTSADIAQQCTAAGGQCDVTIDGFFILVGIFGVAGALWLSYIIPKVLKLADAPASAWRVSPEAFKPAVQTMAADSSHTKSSSDSILSS